MIGSSIIPHRNAKSQGCLVPNPPPPAPATKRLMAKREPLSLFILFFFTRTYVRTYLCGTFHPSLFHSEQEDEKIRLEFHAEESKVHGKCIIFFPPLEFTLHTYRICKTDQTKHFWTFRIEKNFFFQKNYVCVCVCVLFFSDYIFSTWDRLMAYGPF